MRLSAQEHPNLAWLSDHFMRVYVFVALALLVVLAIWEAVVR